MKKLLLIAMLLGLAGCGDDLQGSTPQPQGTQASTQKISNDTTIINNDTLSVAAKSYSTTSTTLPLNGWTITGSSPLGTSTWYDATKIINGSSATSSAIVTPNNSQVAKVLRGGVAGLALGYAIEQLLDAIDWVMDPANNQVRYTVLLPDTYQWKRTGNGSLTPLVLDSKVLEVCENVTEFNNANTTIYRYDLLEKSRSNTSVSCKIRILNRQSGSTVNTANMTYTIVGQPTIIEEKSISLDSIAEQVITNADAGDLDAQVATNAAAQAIMQEAMEDDEKAEPIVEDLERNAQDKCFVYYSRMNDQAGVLERRYDEMYIDQWDLYNKHKPITKPLIINGVKIGSWDGHVQRYSQIDQPNLRMTIFYASQEGCTETPQATKWKYKAPPPRPGVHS